MDMSETNVGAMPVAVTYDGVSIEDIKKQIRENTNAPTMFAKTEVYTSGIEAFINIDHAISQAQKTIKINVFIWSNDSTGLRLAEQLIVAHKHGVNVEVNVDKFGSLVMGNHYVLARWRAYLILKLLPRVLWKIIRYRVRPSTIRILLGMMRDASAIYSLKPPEVAKIEKISSDLISDEMFLKMHDVLQLMQKSGIRLHINNNPIRRIDHSKAVLIDQKLAFMGGMNISDVCSGGFEPHIGWTGKVETNYHRDYWIRMESADMFAMLDHYYFDSPPPTAHTDQPTEQASEMMLLHNFPGYAKPGTPEFGQKKQITYVIEYLLKLAKKHIVIEHAYLMNDNIAALIADAANRGVEIEIIRSSKQHATTETASNKFLQRIRALTRQHRRMLLHIRRHPNILHSKVMAVDDFTVIGSANLSMESLLYHDELSLLIYNNAVQQQILTYLKQAILESRFKRLLRGPRRKYSRELPQETIER